MESLSPTWAPATTYAVCMNLTSFGRSGVQNVSASLIASRDLAGCGSWKKLQFLARCKAHAEPCVDEVPEHRLFFCVIIDENKAVKCCYWQKLASGVRWTQHHNRSQ